MNTIGVSGTPENGYSADYVVEEGRFMYWAMDFNEAIRGVKKIVADLRDNSIKVASARLVGESKPFPDMPDPDIVVTDAGSAWDYKLNSSLQGKYYYSAAQMRKVIEERDELKWRMEGLEK